jgi:hypothetical protein
VAVGLSGSIGEVNIISEDGLVSNQRTLSLRSEVPLLIYSAIILNKDLLYSIATGAVQKNITHKNILNISIGSLLSTNELKNISQLYLKLLIMENKIIKIKSKLIKLLIKGSVENFV